MFCRNCGKEIGFDAFCRFCGSAQNAAGPASAVTARNPYAGKKEMAWGAGMLLVGIIGFLISLVTAERDSTIAMSSIIFLVIALAGGVYLFIGRAKHWWHAE